MSAAGTGAPLGGMTENGSSFVVPSGLTSVSASPLSALTRLLVLPLPFSSRRTLPSTLVVANW